MVHLLTNPFTPAATPTSIGVRTAGRLGIRHRTFEACSAISLHASPLRFSALAARSNSECNVLVLVAQSPSISCKPRTASIFSRGDALQ